MAYLSALLRVRLMNRVCLFVLVFIVTFVSHSASADDSRSTAASLAQAYVSLLGCEHSTITDKTNLHVTDGDPGYGMRTYYLIGINADIDCGGGTGSDATRLIVVSGYFGRQADDPKFIPAAGDLRVRPDVSSPQVVLIDPPRFITEIFQKDGVIYSIGMRYGPKDAECCPSLTSTDRIDMELDQSIKDRFGEYHSVVAWRFTPVAQSSAIRRSPDNRPDRTHD